jgi:predicted SprT family Zn-dependent metalloprotease
MNTIEKRIETPMSNEDLEKYLAIKPEDIIKYSELSNYKTIQQLLPKDNDFRIILIEEKKNFGHFVSVQRQGKVITYYNSYGAKCQKKLEQLRDENTPTKGKYKGVRPSADWIVAKYIK